MKRYWVIALFCLSTVGIYAQETPRVTVYFTYKHSFGLLEKNIIRENKQGLYGNALFIKGMYSINNLVAIGAGLGADVLMMPRYTTFPLFASVHVTPLANKKLFVYNDLGYSLNTTISYPGLYEEVGMGYRWMFKKHFGMSLNIGYSLKQMQNIQIEYKNGREETAYTTRHSIIAGLGFVF